VKLEKIRPQTNKVRALFILTAKKLLLVGRG